MIKVSKADFNRLSNRDTKTDYQKQIPN